MLGAQWLHNDKNNNDAAKKAQLITTECNNSNK